MRSLQAKLFLLSFSSTSKLMQEDIFTFLFEVFNQIRIINFLSELILKDTELTFVFRNFCTC